MKAKTVILRILKATLMMILFAFLYYDAKAQADTTKVNQPDTTLQATEEKGEKVDRKRRDEFILFAGVNFSNLNVSSDDYDSPTKMGYHLGGYYKRGKFFYWQVGARFCNSNYALDNINMVSDSTNDFLVTSIDVPLTAGINLLSATNRVLALRVFASAVPAFTLGVADNDISIEKDDLNSFVLYGQGGVGVNVAFLVIEAGYNYGFQDLLKNDIKSAPGQLFVNLGFRF